MLVGRVRPIGLAAITKAPRLDVEEQRAEVPIDILSLVEQVADLDDGYTIDAKITRFKRADATTVSAGALFRRVDSWQSLCRLTGAPTSRPSPSCGDPVSLPRSLRTSASV